MNITLHGEWELTYHGKQQLIQVPSVLEQYLEQKEIETSFQYQKTFTLEKKKDRRYFLHCDGISCAAHIYLNDQKIGDVEGIWTAHTLEITDALSTQNTLRILVEKPSFDQSNPYYYRSILFGFIPDVLFPFSGIYKDIYIEERNSVHLDQVQLYFDYETKELVMESQLNEEGYELAFQIEQQLVEHVPYQPIVRIALTDIRYWSPQDPQRYHITVSLWHHTLCLEEKQVVLGYRQIQVSEHQILLNGTPAHFRGILHWGYYPEQYHVIPTREMIKQELLAIREQGFNAVKFCLFLPEPAYYELCDELGILVWQELPLWLPYDNGYLFPRIYEQYPKFMKMIRSHPSLFMISIGCELDQTIPKETLDTLYHQITQMKTQAIVCDNSGSGECYDGALHSESDIYDYHFYGEIHNMQKLIHEFQHCSRPKKPWLFGEFNDMDTFRNLSDVKQQSTYDLYWANPNPKVNLLRYVHANAVSDMPIYEYDAIVEKNELGESMEQLLHCANQKGYDVRKYNLETTRKHPITGYSITAIRDVPITSCGIFDDFQQKKWSDEAMQSINGDIVLSMSAPLKRKWVHGADVFQSLDEYNFYEQTTLANRIHVSNHTSIEGDCEVMIQVTGTSVHLQQVKQAYLHAHTEGELLSLDIKLPKVTKATRLSLDIRVSQQKELAHNHWDLWVYPRQSASLQLFDPTNIFEGIEEVMEVIRVQDFMNLDTNKPLVTTVLNETMLQGLPKGLPLIYIQNGEGYFPLVREPFWRECVRLLSKDTLFDQLATKGYDSLQFISLTTDMGILPEDIRKVCPTYQRIMSRIDNRRFHRTECVFQFEKDGHSILTTTLQFGHTTGTQARSFEENVFAQQVLIAMLQQQESTYDTTNKGI